MLRRSKPRAYRAQFTAHSPATPFPVDDRPALTDLELAGPRREKEGRGWCHRQPGRVPHDWEPLVLGNTTDRYDYTRILRRTDATITPLLPPPSTSPLTSPPGYPAT
jgi:hypothetical protein